MRLIAILLALLIVGFLINKQMGPRSDKKMEDAQTVSDPSAPRVPTNPGEGNQFGAQMDDYMKKEAAKRAEAIEAAESR